MSSNITWPGIHFQQSYIDYQYDWNHFSTYVAVIPWFYTIPTFIVMWRIFKIFLRFTKKKSFNRIDRNVLLVICLSQFTCFALFFFDYFMTRFPSSGVVTAWCATIKPNHWLKMILFFTLYFTYLAMVIPFLMPVVRLFIVLFPSTHSEINAKLINIGVPIFLFYPLCFTFYFIPALGICKQASFPYPFGSVTIYYTNSAFGLRNGYFHLYNIVFWMAASVAANAVLFYKVVNAKSKLVNKSRNSYKAELSMTITTLSMIASYAVNAIFLVLYISFAGTNAYVSYAEIARPFGNDLQTCVTTWLFYSTHPVFKKQSGDMEAMFSTSSSQKKTTSNQVNVKRITA
ncbi:hypothetical protein L5515_010723 [Caenorhabditis briggsae]|uniref:Uncharacterized protein n=1 Tax=Caenorhabditis briggsae TaxID=6238 RepID=A0AAE9JEI0_CAEBR|nr:hypothetical protein L5515_010723 [Caenorhabditis briggsae]